MSFYFKKSREQKHLFKMEDEQDYLTPEKILQNIPFILNKILSYLPAKSLNSCARVCSAWSSLVKGIKQSRRDTSWFFSECQEDGVDKIAEEMKAFTENVSSEPGTVFVFCTSHLMEKPIRVPSRHPMRLPRSAKCEVIEMEEYLKSLLPKTCNLYAIAADGVVGTSKDLKTTKEMEQAEAISCLYLPKLDKLSFHHFILDNHTHKVDDSGSSVFDAAKASHIPAGKKVGAIFMFCDEPYSLPEISYGLKSHFSQAVLAGGYVDQLIALDSLHNSNGTEESENDSILCVALCGESVHVRSVVIKEEVSSRSEVEKKIKSLKDCHLPEGRSFAFMFACIGRGNAHYREENVETQVFRKMFPNTPIFGFFGNGEIGFNSLQEYALDSTDVSSVDRTTPSVNHLPKLHHAYTTILVLVSVT